MEDDASSTLEKIKLEEQVKEAKLKEKREHTEKNVADNKLHLIEKSNREQPHQVLNRNKYVIDAIVEETAASNLNQSIREALLRTEKFKEEEEILTKSTHILRKQKMVLECRRDALSAELESLQKQLDELRAKLNKDISVAWEKRSSFCKEIHSVSDVCDVWTLLMKPGYSESASQVFSTKMQSFRISENEKKLQIIIEKRDEALAERDRLNSEPENGEEFKRIKNALHYTLDQIANLNK